MAITERTSKIIWGQCAAKCCICKEDVLHQDNGRVSSLTGEIAHIVGKTRKAARGVSSLSSAERDEVDNLLLLCRKHHKIVDDNPEEYPVAHLHQIKDEHITWITSRLATPMPWKSNLSQLTYINVPRICEQAELQGFHVDLRQYKEDRTLHSLGWELNQVMSSFRETLAHLSINAIPIQTVALHEGYVGMPISFDSQRFRTKNVPSSTREKVGDFPEFTGDLTRDPHIYLRLGEFRVVLFIDPRWITTSTAFTLFRPSSGQSTFSMLGRITGVDYEAAVITVTPWVIGLPKEPFYQRFEDQHSSAIEDTESISLLDALVDLGRAELDHVYFHPAPEHCDLCRRSMANEKYLIDGAVNGLSGWACMCARCFLVRGQRIAWGHGQLYRRDDKGWLEVAGFPPKESQDAF